MIIDFEKEKIIYEENFNENQKIKLKYIFNHFYINLAPKFKETNIKKRSYNYYSNKFYSLISKIGFHNLTSKELKEICNVIVYMMFLKNK